MLIFAQFSISLAHIKVKSGKIIVAELAPFRRTFKTAWFWLALVVVVLLLVGAYQFPFTRKFDLSSPSNKAYLFGYYQVERFENFVYCWTRPTSHIVLPGVGQLSNVKVQLDLNTRPANLPPTPIRLSANSSLSASFSSPTLAELHKVYNFDYNFEHRALFSFAESRLDLELATETLQVTGDPRRLGIAVAGIEVAGAGLLENGRVTIPDWNLIATVLVGVVLLFGLGLRLGWSAHLSALGVIIFGLLIAIGLVLDRPTTALTVPLLLEGLLLSYPMVVLGLGWTAWWLTRKGLPFNSGIWRWLGVFFVVAFTLRSAYLNHPVFQTIDHGFRIHEVAALKNDPSLLITRYYNMNTFRSADGQKGHSVTAGQWNLQVALPYTPLFYILDLLIAWLTVPNDAKLLHWTNVFADWLDVSAMFFVYIIACQTLRRDTALAGLVGAVLFCFFPLSYLMVSDGGYNTILASWLTLAWLVVFTDRLRLAEQSPPISATPESPSSDHKIRRGVRMGWAGALLALVFLSHVATLLLVSVFTACYLFLLVCLGGSSRYLLKPIVAMYAIALGLSFTLYYGFYIVAFVSSTLPTIGHELEQGKVIGDNRLMREGFWATLQAHFHLLPFLLTGGIIAWIIILKWIRPRLIYIVDNMHNSGRGAKMAQVIKPPTLKLRRNAHDFALSEPN